eukprot:gnl/TRDRNA2_/TRDRNA2_151858_c0_seq2.p1 gnl/TRDRNA2_/TRDRNA2_151858_c0~~gnl/TRDRNA2_/TRDRNA2_151858_c0_seq2.p1  ORF type:complete len:239 (+),score=40.04 gnl/TRDRNA2_/TRDRNA2_151858_c0_seq2:57-719(+)
MPSIKAMKAMKKASKRKNAATEKAQMIKSMKAKTCVKSRPPPAVTSPVVVTNLAGDKVFGPSELPMSMTGYELKAQIASKKKLSSSCRIRLVSGAHELKEYDRLGSCRSSVEEPLAFTMIQHIEAEHEELDQVPLEEKVQDPLWGAKIKRTINNHTFRGEVVNIERGQVSGEHLYLILYEDDDREHLTRDELLVFVKKAPNANRELKAFIKARGTVKINI